MKRCLGFLRLFLLWAAGFGLTAHSVSAQAYEITDYQIHINIYQQYFEVREDLDVMFHAPRHGIFRILPLKYLLKDSILNATVFDQWLGYPIYISNIKVPGNPDKINRENGMVKIRIGDKNQMVTGLQHYTISYRVKNAFLSYRDRSVFYWNLIGTQWDAPIDKVNYTISLYKPIELNASDYTVTTGASGGTAHAATITFQNGQLTGGSTQTLKSGEGLTIQITFPKDFVQPFSTSKRIWHSLRWFLLPLLLIIMFIGAWSKVGKDRKIIRVVSYLPPKGIDPAMAGFLLNDRSDNRDLISLLPYWAAAEMLMMEYEPKKHFWNKDEWTIIKQKDISGDAPDYEQTIFNGLFVSGNNVTLSSLKNSFYKTMNTAQSKLRQQALKSGLYTPASVRLFHFSQWVILLTGFFSVAILFSINQPAAAILTIVVTVVLIVLNNLLLKRSQRGDEVFQQLKGFKMFVEKAERPKLETLLKEDPAYFEKTLGYAVAFNLLEKWTHHFDGLMQEPPSWYHGYNGASFRMSTFASQFGQGMSTMQTIMTSGSSGSGGSSGGGFGGGGGGSW